MVLIYHTQKVKAREIAEMIPERDQEIQIVDDIHTLISKLKSYPVGKLYFQVRGLSDFHKIDTVRSISPDLEISLLVNSDMEKLLILMKTTAFDILPTDVVR